MQALASHNLKRHLNIPALKTTRDKENQTFKALDSAILKKHLNIPALESAKT